MSEADKTRDKNVRNIEKDIERCEQLTKPEHANWIGISNQLAISHILAELEQMLKEREKYTIHLTDEEYRKVIANAQKNVANDSVIAHKFAVMQQQIDEKDKRIQELEEELEEFNKQLDLDYVDENFISKQVVIDTMEELKTKRRKLGFKIYLRREDMLNEDKMIVCKIEVLQELLERKK